MKYKEFQLSDFFNRKTTNTYSGYTTQDLIIPDSGGKTPVIGNSKKNNGIIGYTTLDANNDGMVITFSDTVNPEDTFFYQKKSFVGFSHVNLLSPKKVIASFFNERHALYIITAIKKSIDGRFDYSDKFTSQIDQTLIALPCSDNEDIPDWNIIDNIVTKTINEYSRYYVDKKEKELKQAEIEIRKKSEFYERIGDQLLEK